MLYPAPRQEKAAQFGGYHGHCCLRNHLRRGALDIGCQSGIAGQINCQGGDYVLMLKNNQPKMLSSREFESVTRNHWRVENSLHWLLDVSFREDESADSRGVFSGGLFRNPSYRSDSAQAGNANQTRNQTPAKSRGMGRKLLARTYQRKFYCVSPAPAPLPFKKLLGVLCVCWESEIECSRFKMPQGTFLSRFLLK